MTRLQTRAQLGRRGATSLPSPFRLITHTARARLHSHDRVVEGFTFLVRITQVHRARPRRHRRPTFRLPRSTSLRFHPCWVSSGQNITILFRCLPCRPSRRLYPTMTVQPGLDGFNVQTKGDHASAMSSTLLV